jgi:hypothetical protein
MPFLLAGQQLLIAFSDESQQQEMTLDKRY